MPYRSGFEWENGGIGPYLGAIPFAAVGAAFIGISVLIVWSLPQIPWSLPSSLGNFALGSLAILAGVSLMVTAATFAVGFYLAIFGLPIALALGRHLHSPWALAVALMDAGASALFAVAGNRFAPPDFGESTVLLFLWVLSFALPAGYLYRRAIIALREQARAFNGY